MRLYTSRLEEDKDPYLMYCNFQGIASIVPKLECQKLFTLAVTSGC